MRVNALGVNLPPLRLHPVNTTYCIAWAHEMVCPLICKLMGKRYDGYRSIGSRATPALDYH
jgi:hypothetical protein